MALHRYRPYDVAQIRQPTINWNDVEYAGNMAGHVADYALGRGDFAPLPPAKHLKRDNNEYMEADSTTNEGFSIDNGNTSGAKALGVSGTGSKVTGFRGKFVGNTCDIPSYLKKYHETIECDSKKLRSLNLTWGVSIYSPKDRASLNQFPMYKWGEASSIIPGIPWISEKDLRGNPNINPFQPFGTGNIQSDFSENVYSNPINFKLGDFIDNKTLADDSSVGIGYNFNKFRLKSFTVEITTESRNLTIRDTVPNVLSNAIRYSGWYEQLPDGTKTIFDIGLAEQDYSRVKQGYFIFRDIFGTYADSSDSNIPLIPPESKGDQNAQDVVKRETYAIKNMDRNLTYIEDGEKFSFTREINPQGSYYMTSKNIKDNLKTNISKIVNLLEGQVLTDTNTIAKPLPEYFNLLICPAQCHVTQLGMIPMRTVNRVVENGYLLLPKLITKIKMKTTARWEAFDFNYRGTQVPARMVDPLEQAIFDYNSEITLDVAKANRI